MLPTAFEARQAVAFATAAEYLDAIIEYFNDHPSKINVTRTPWNRDMLEISYPDGSTIYYHATQVIDCTDTGHNLPPLFDVLKSFHDWVGLDIQAPAN